MVMNAEPEFEFAIEVAKKYGCKEGSALPLYLDYKRHFRPQVERTEPEVLQDAFDQMLEAVKILQDGMMVDRVALMKEHGLDPHNKSDSAKTRLFLKESGLLQIRGGTPETWVRRITNANGDDKSSNNINTDVTPAAADD